MGNPGKPKTASSIQHFSHQHPLQLLNTKADPSLNSVSCVGCKLQPSEWVYACKPCNFLLHIPCSEMPQSINHPADPNHSFTLLAKPAYPSGIFGCDACGRDGDGFNYHCSLCGIDIHITCATIPLSLTHKTHPHPLNLVFSRPIPSQGYFCDICSLSAGSNHWVYRCEPCDFDAHLQCATNKPLSSLSSPSATEEEKQNFIQKFEAAQKVDKERMLSLIKGGNDGNDLIELQKYFRSDNSATGVVTQEYVQRILGDHSGGGGDGASKNNLGDSRRRDQQEAEEALEAVIFRNKIEARSQQAILDLLDDRRYVYTTGYSYI